MDNVDVCDNINWHEASRGANCTGNEEYIDKYVTNTTILTPICTAVLLVIIFSLAIFKKSSSIQ